MRSMTTARKQHPRDLVPQILLATIAGLVYFGVRGLTQGAPAEAVTRGLRILEFEARLGLDLERGAQALILESDTWTTLANWVYIWGHWPVIITALLVLHRYRRSEYLRLRNGLFISGLIGMMIFALFPTAPPRLMGLGFVDTLDELSTSYRVLQPPALVNKYAALPSLHVGWNLLVAISVYRASSRRIARLLAIASVTAMVLAVVFTGNHWVVDTVAGTLVALAGLAIATRIGRSTDEQPLAESSTMEQPACQPCEPM